MKNKKKVFSDVFLTNLTRIREIIKKWFDLKEISTKLSTDFVDKLMSTTGSIWPTLDCPHKYRQDLIGQWDP